MPHFLDHLDTPSASTFHADSRSPVLLTILLAAALLLTGCSGDSTDPGTGNSTSGSGGSAGEQGPDDGGLLAVFTGVWDITGNWSGRPDDKAVLAIGEEQDGATAPVRLYDDESDAIGSGENCYRPGISTGELAPSLDGRFFLSGLFQFQEAVVSLSVDQQTMTILFFDAQDINANGDTNEQLEYAAQRVGLTETDLPVCQ